MRRLWFVWMVIAMVIVVVVSCWSGCWGSVLVGSMMAAGTALLTTVIIYAVVVTALVIYAQYKIGQMEDGPLKILAQIVLAAVLIYLGGPKTGVMNPETYLALATSTTMIVFNSYTAIQMKDLAEKRRIKEIEESVDDRIDDQSGWVIPASDMSAHYSHSDINSPDALYASSTSMFDFDQFWSVTDQLDLRVNVVSG